MIRVTDTKSEKEQNWVKACEIYLQSSCDQDRRGKVLSCMFDYIQSGKLPFDSTDN